jgi:hypothetical protein
VAVSGNGKVMTSPDAITWTPQTSALNNNWTSVTYGNNLFVAVSYQGNIMTSGNGILWILQSPPVNPLFPTQTYYGTWYSVTYGNGSFVAVAEDYYYGTGSYNVLTSSHLEMPSVTIVDNVGNSITTGTAVTFTATPTNGGSAPAYQGKKNKLSLYSPVSYKMKNEFT